MKSLTFTFAHKLALACILILLLVWAQKVLAVPSLIPESGKIGTGTECDFNTGKIGFVCFKEYIKYLLALVFGFTGIFFLMMIVFSGYQIALGTVTGNKEKGKEMLKGAIVGFIISALSLAIVSFFLAAGSGSL